MKPTVAAVVLACLAARASAAVPNQDGLLGVNKTQAAQTLAKGHLLVSGYSLMVNNDGVFDHGEISRGGHTGKPDQVTAMDGYVSVDFGFLDDLEAALSAPVYYEKVLTDSISDRGFSPGEAKLLVKYRLPFGAVKRGWSAALLAGASVPTSQGGAGIIPRRLEYVSRTETASAKGSRAFGTGSAELYAAAALSGVFGDSRPPLPWSWHLNLGLSQPLAGGFDNVFALSTAAEYQFDPYFEMYCELHHETGLARIAGADQWSKDPTALTVAGVATTSLGVQVQAGLSFGLLRGGSTPVTHVDAHGDSLERFGWKASPSVAFTLGLSWNIQLIPPDQDRDGVPDYKDRCPTQPEDKDGYQDQDGCPETDNDNDGVPDMKDRCPLFAEDKDGYQDDDGCPDPDNDQDGVPDAADKCPDQAGPPVSEGCPDGGGGAK